MASDEQNRIPVCLDFDSIESAAFAIGKQAPTWSAAGGQNATERDRP